MLGLSSHFANFATIASSPKPIQNKSNSVKKINLGHKQILAYENGDEYVFFEDGLSICCDMFGRVKLVTFSNGDLIAVDYANSKTNYHLEKSP